MAPNSGREGAADSRVRVPLERRDGQAIAPRTRPFDASAFGSSTGTTLRWLGMAGFFINSRGTSIMIDPLLGGFDMPIVIEMPIAAPDVPRLDGVLVTHSDNDHFSRPTCRDLAAGVTGAFHSTTYVASLMDQDGLVAVGHKIGDVFDIGPIQIQLTPADHAWQNEIAGESSHFHLPQDACGFWLETPDGTVWAPGDSRLIPDHHLNMPTADAMLFDFSDSDWHFGLTGAVTMANAYPTTPLLLYHWGSVAAPDFPPFNGDPDVLYDLISNPERIHVLAPGEPFEFSRRTGPSAP